MNDLILAPSQRSVIPALAAAAGERARMRFLEFFAANIRNPHTRRAYARAADEIPGLVRERRRSVDRCHSAGARCHLDRGRHARASCVERQAKASRDPSPVQLARDRPGRAGQPDRLGARASARRDVRCQKSPQSRANTNRVFAGNVMAAEVGKPSHSDPSAVIPPKLPCAFRLNHWS